MVAGAACSSSKYNNPTNTNTTNTTTTTTILKTNGENLRNDFHLPPAPQVSTSTTTVQSSGFTCADGSHSNAVHSQGACSHHGGIK